jgi:hypothetical protein
MICFNYPSFRNIPIVNKSNYFNAIQLKCRGMIFATKVDCTSIGPWVTVQKPTLTSTTWIW